MEFYFSGIRNIFIEGKDYACVLFCGCDFRCVYCYNSQILEFRNEFLTRISSVKSMIRNYNRVLFAGAEPCLQRQALISLSRFCKQNSIKTILQTNGSRPDTIHYLVREDLIDTFFLDIKSSLDGNFERITRSETYFKTGEEILKNIERTINILKRINARVIVKTTFIPNYLYRKEDILKIAALANDMGCRLEFQQFIPGNTADKKLQGIRPLSNRFLLNMKDICLRHFPELKIEIKY